MTTQLFRAIGLSAVLLVAACGSTTSSGGGSSAATDTGGGGGCAKKDPKNVSCTDTTPCTVTCDCGGGSTMEAGGCNAGFCASAEETCKGACGASWAGGFCSPQASGGADTTSGGGDDTTSGGTDDTGGTPGCSSADPANKSCTDTDVCTVTCTCSDGGETTSGTCNAGFCASAKDTCNSACSGAWGGKFCGK